MFCRVVLFSLLLLCCCTAPPPALANRDDTIKVVSAIKSRTSKLAEMMAVLLGLEHPQLPGADRLGGLGQLENCREEECIAALDQLSGVMHHFKPEAIFATVGQQKREEGLLKLEVGGATGPGGSRWHGVQCPVPLFNISG
jgi:hypothetical protein